MSPRAEIEALMRERTGREALLTPSGRMALWLALRGWVAPGASLLMSPLTCDTVLLAVLAAGLRPVMAPLALADAGIDLEAVPDATWRQVGAVLTTNLFGQPDRVLDLRAKCAALGIPLIEDVAQAMESEVAGRPLGAFGAAAVFSFAKHAAAGGGGALVFDDRSRREDLERLLEEALDPRGRLRLAADLVSPSVMAALPRFRLVRPARWVAGRLGLAGRIGVDRLPLAAAELWGALAKAPGMRGLDAWNRLDFPSYRLEVPPALARRMLARLKPLGRDRAARLEAVGRLVPLPAAAFALAGRDPNPLLAVPFLVANRDEARRELRRRLIPVRYVYDPPLDDHLGEELVQRSAGPGPARWWAEHVLPVDPLDAGRAFAYLARLEPARPPVQSTAGRSA